MQHGAKVAVMVGLAIAPAAIRAQQTGVSHPEDIPVTTSPEGISQPVVYEGQTNSVSTTTVVESPGLRTRAPQNLPAGYVPTPAATAAAVETPLAAPAQAYVPYQPVAAAATMPAPVPPAEPTRDLHASVGEPAPLARPDSARLVTPADPDANIVTRVPGPANQIPNGTFFKVSLREKLSTGHTQPGALFTAELEQSVERDGRILLPAGSIVRGKVTEVHGGKRVSGTASIHLEPTSVVLPDGTSYPVHAQVIDTSLYRQQKVDGEGTILRSDHVKGTVAAFGLATGSGAAAGAVFGGWPGALIGAAAGAGISTVVWLKQDHQTELPAGTGLTFELTRPMTVGLE